jgi:hypothetical protein
VSDNAAKWYLRTQDETFGPETEEKLVAWAKMGRIQPGQELSDDNIVWKRVEDVPFLDMRFSIDMGDGNPKGPFNKAAAEALIASGRLPKSASIVEVRAPFDAPSPDPQPPVQPPPQPKVIVKEVRVEVPVEKVVVKEVRVEVPVEVEKVVVDETRVKELEGLLAAAERRVEDAKREAAKLSEQVTALEDELRRLPQAASEVADIQAAMFAAMTSEAEELQKMLEEEKREADDFRKRHQERADRLLERRRNLLKRSGSNIEEMTRRALIERPEDPRTAQYRKELEELRRLSERKAFDYEDRIRDLESKLKIRETEMARAKSAMKDITQLQSEAQSLREQLQLREKELITERQKNEEHRQQQAFAQQAMMARLASLESPSIGTAQSMSTNQSREAKLVKLPRWMQLGK